MMISTLENADALSKSGLFQKSKRSRLKVLELIRLVQGLLNKKTGMLV
jgi:hypothetical protein